MKKVFAALLVPLAFGGCNFDEFPEFTTVGNFDYAQQMRNFVESISSYAASIDSSFIIIVEDAPELVTTTGSQTAPVDTDYVNALDALAQTGLFYGGTTIDRATSDAERNRLQAYLDLAQDEGAEIMVTDFATTEANIENAYDLSDDAGYIAFVADHTELDDIPLLPDPINNRNALNIDRLSQTQNFLNLIDTRLYSTRQDLVNDIVDTDYDVIVIDFFFNGLEYTADQINDLKFKDNGRRRLLIATMNIGEAEDNRYYWESFWPTNPPEWLGDAVPDNEYGYYVEYWDPEWQDIIFGNDDSYLFRIIDAGFDGVYLKSVDVYEYFEDLDPEGDDPEESED